MGFIVRLHESTGGRPTIVGRVHTAGDAFALLRRWREDQPDSWVEIVPPFIRPRGEAA
ncbi:MAG: hypothetical protein HYX51_00065 [Chloroflexi bacterium]|nr:hypothetical protein [Chloroflexota bacterium]